MLSFFVSWEQRKLFDVAQYRNGKAHENDIDDDGKYVVVNSKFVSTNGEIRKNSNKQNEPLLKNEIAFVLSDVPNGRALARTYIVEKDGKYTLNQRIAGITPNKDINPYYLYILMNRNKYFLQFDDGAKQTNLSLDDMKKFEEYYPKTDEQTSIGDLFHKIDNLITLHQHVRMGDKKMIKNKLFSVYYESWIKVYKEGAIRKVTMDKYKLTLSWIKKLAPKMTMKDLNRITYQELLNGYAEYHERQSTMDFHHQLKGAILDAVDEGLIDRDPTRKAIIKGKSPRDKKIKYLNQFELHKLISDLDLENELNYDWLILLIAKTGIRFSEALAVTPKDFDLMHQMLIINKTWNYKDGGGFSPTKNESSNRKIQIDWQTAMQFAELIKELPEDKPIFAFNKVYNSTINDILARHCRKMEIPVISVHGLRHTHASILLFAGVSIASVAHRLGHSSMTTTQKTYLHIIQELENADIDLIMRSLSSLNR